MDSLLAVGLAVQVVCFGLAELAVGLGFGPAGVVVPAGSELAVLAVPVCFRLAWLRVVVDYGLGEMAVHVPVAPRLAGEEVVPGLAELLVVVSFQLIEISTVAFELQPAAHVVVVDFAVRP